MTLIQFTAPLQPSSLINYCGSFLPILQSDFAGAAFEGLKKSFCQGGGKKKTRPPQQRADEQNADGETDVWRNFDLVHC